MTTTFNPEALKTQLEGETNAEAIFDIISSNAICAADQAGDYDTLEEAYEAYFNNAADTFADEGVECPSHIQILWNIFTNGTI